MVVKYNKGDILGPANITMLERTVKMKNGAWKANFICPECGKIFETKIDNIVKGATQSCGCLHLQKCCKNLQGEKFGQLTVLEDSGKRDYEGRVLWKCKCDCGNYAEVSSKGLLHGGTLSCGCLKSKGEKKVGLLLQKIGVQFEKEKTFKDCVNPKTGHKLRFDFYLPDYNICIEYDGTTHYGTTNGGWQTLENFSFIQYSDHIKNQYCENNNIKLIRIPYWDYNNLNETYLMERVKNDKLL